MERHHPIDKSVTVAALAWSAVAVVVAVAARTLADVAQSTIVVAVIVVGFAAGWIVSGSDQRDHPRHCRHRTVTVPVRSARVRRH